MRRLYDDALPVRLYRRAMVILPREFRRRYAAGMVAMLADEWRERRGLARGALLARALFDLLRTAAIERISGSGGRHQQEAGMRRVNLVEDARKDFRHGLRLLRRSPGFTATAILTLSLGIAASTGMFSVVNGVLLRPLPYPEPDHLVRVHLASPERGVQRSAVSLPDFEDWRESSDAFSSLAAYFSFTRNVTGTGQPVALRSTYVSEDFFDTLGRGAQIGRVLSKEEIERGAATVVLSNGVWQEHFGGDPSVLGASVNLDGTPHTVVGVMRPDFRFPGADLWVPLPRLVKADLVPINRSARWLAIVGRLHAGVTVEQAGLEMSAITERLSQHFPASNEGWNGATVLELRQTIVGDVAPALLVALAAVAFVLLMVCANVASLLLVRAAARGREMALRAALGARHMRLVGELFVESLVLALLGGVFAIVLTIWAMGTVRSLILPILPRVEDLAIDLRVLGFAFVATILTSVLLGIVPALGAGRPDLQEVLRKGGRGHVPRQRFRTGLVVLQVALAVVLTIGAGLMLKNFGQLQSIDPGFNPDGVLTARIQVPIPSDRSQLRTRVVGDTERMLEQLRALPGVEAAGSINVLPLREDGGLLPLSAGEPQDAGNADLLARPKSVSGDYFHVMEIPLIAGEIFPESMAEDAPSAAVISETTARRLWPNNDPIGQELWLGIPYRVIGVVGDVRGAGLADESPLTVYRHQSQQSMVDVTFVIRTAGDPGNLAAVRDAIWRVNSSQPVTIDRLSNVVSASVAQDRFFTLLLAGFGTVALLLAALGLYGVLAYTVNRQTREIALRRALGARRSALLRMILGRGMFLAGLGVVLGLVGAMGMMRLLSGMLHRVSTLDPATYAGVVVLVLVTALLAAYLPARRAMRTDPMVALKVEY